MKKQHHLSSKIPDSLLERLLLRNKFRIEEAKIKINKFFTLKTRYPDYGPLHFKDSEEIVKIMKYVQYTPMMNLTDSKERIIVWKLINPDPEKFVYEEVLKSSVAVFLRLISCDYAVGEIALLDWKGVTLKHLAKMYPIVTMKALKIYIEAYSARISGVHNINVPSFFDNFIAVLKPFLPEKLLKKVTISKNLEELHDKIPKEHLPCDYGGERESLEELNDKWTEEIKAHWSKIKELNEMMECETCEYEIRKRNDNLFGIDGNFKQINLD